MSKVLLPPPYAFGLPAKFQQWREDQHDAFQIMLDAPSRFVGLTMPTGSGKTVAEMAAIATCTGRAVMLTATKGLQNQASEEFPNLVLDVRGQKNYPCKALLPGGEFFHLQEAHYKSDLPTCEEGPCHAGAKCTLKEAGCEYYDRIRLGTNLPIVTNYALWIAMRRYGQGLGKVDLLLLDEAHQAFDELAGALTIRLEKWLLNSAGVQSLPPENGTLQQWRDWARYHAAQMRKKLEILGSPSSKAEVKHRRRVKQVERTLSQIGEMELGNWIPDHSEQEWRFEVLNPAAYAEQYLFQGASKVVLLSATLTPKTLQLLGVSNYTHWECPSRFPVGRRPIYFIPTTQVSYKMKPEQWQLWLSRIDQIISPRQDRKGLIHSVSYKRRDYILAGTSYGSLMMTHGNKPGEAQAAVKAFKARQVPTVLLSPSMTTGWDFPYDQCRYQIVTKLPFPDTQSKVMKARTEGDPEYMPYLTAQSLVQAVGRGMRAEDDWCETFIIDDQWKWFVRHRKLMPQWFLEAIKTSIVLPKPYKEALTG